ncbi:MAG: hypothetical protein WBZ36_11450 [Candidatus Nitrosopolaris sp.]
MSTKRGCRLKSSIQRRKPKYPFKRLGILSLTWTSKHYELEYVKSLITNLGFEIINIQHIGSHVYGPLADYYAQNRMRIKDIILKEGTNTSSKYPIQGN